MGFLAHSLEFSLLNDSEDEGTLKISLQQFDRAREILNRDGRIVDTDGSSYWACLYKQCLIKIRHPDSQVDADDNYNLKIYSFRSVDSYETAHFLKLFNK